MKYRQGVDFADIQYCGQVDGCLILDGASPSITHTVVQYSGTRGIFAAGAAFPRIQDTTIQNNNGNGIDVSGPGGLDPGARFSSNVISGNGGYPIGVPAGSVGQLDTSSSFSGNGSDYLRVTEGTVSGDATWSRLDVLYRVAGDVSVGGAVSPALTLEAGATLLFEPGSDLVVGPAGSPGTLNASGTSALPIIFSSAQGTASPGDWGGIRLESACTGPPVLGHVIVEDAGANGLGNVVWQSCNGTISDSTVSHSSHWGIYRNNANPVITNVTYSDNADGDINP